MAAQKGIAMNSRHARQTQGGTPARRTNYTSNQYFEPGKVGRKTGITLKDTGIRDDHGLEPMSGIFSSPGSAQRSTFIEEEDVEDDEDEDDDGSADMEGLNSIEPDIDETLRSRRNTRLPPARSTPQRRVNISQSPHQQSSPAQDQSTHSTSRRLKFRGNGVRHSIEKRSPFKPKHVLRRSVVGEASEVDHRRQNTTLNANIRSSASKTVRSPGGTPHRQVYTDQTLLQPQFIGADDDDLINYQEDDDLQYSTREEIEGAIGLAGTLLHSSSPTTPRKRGREGAERTTIGSTNLETSIGSANLRTSIISTYPRTSVTNTNPRTSIGSTDHDSTNRKRSNASIDNTQHIPEAAHMVDSSRKRLHYTMSEGRDEQADEHTSHNFASDARPSSHRQIEQAPEYDERIVGDYGSDDADDYDDDVSVDLPVAEPSEHSDVAEESPQPPVRSKKANKAPRKAKSSPQKSRVRIAAPPRSQRSESVGSDSESGPETSRSKRSGSRSNVELRSTTPFEDAGQRTSRSGRPILKPLDWWAGEAVVWKNGEVDGVIRANSIEPEKRPNKRRNAHKKKTKKLKAGLDAIDEGDEDLLPSDWEEEIGVLTGDVAQWNAAMGVGDENNLVTEDIAFAASSIITKPVAGSSFTYAKIQTLPFFGSGVVEIPPDGEKSTKNSRKMQMNFFVHKGKVLVTVTSPTGPDQRDPVSSSSFSITEGGAWVVPRGNNYAVQNMSSNSTAYLFFSQGCEIEASGDEDED